MAPQFVDYNADGHIDIVTATYDGSPHVALGSKDGFGAPERVLDAGGKRVMLAQFWNYESSKWDSNAAQPKGHCTSAVAFDWDADGDLDLLLGSYGDGKLYRQMNEGKPGAPKFTGVNVPVTAGGKTFDVAGGITTPRLVDWDSDGLTDLLIGGYGDSFGQKEGGGVWLYRNVGKLGAPSFDAPLNLIPRSPKGADGPTRPDAGLYADAVDYDGDGDLDLVVGGYSLWVPEPRVLTDEEEARSEELSALLERQQSELSKMYETLETGEDTTPEEAQARFEKLRNTTEYSSLMTSMQSARAEYSELVPPPSREAFVWLYRRTDVAAGGEVSAR